ncbi:protein artichoke [Bicyclus anynana]|uniref:Protein artichoke n=1 Tax=Bicyclus anynana TaxID=110368 RepID=A0ABM3M0Y2_BICAN|nr:protein artichoke [Bicyclus anynana]XP_052744997.1 protein artichoke [Bicyclus anynana]XP_052744999.1 protein artichoke [Bicyclus anynana]XP_052745000.1 protein artichoke [Bicyclus anynana]XP_052745001.1 protein artichoke [Bicyclus anynana]
MARKKSLWCYFFLVVLKETSASVECSFIDAQEIILMCIPVGVPDVILKLESLPLNGYTEMVLLRACGITELEHDSLKKTSLKYIDLSENRLKELDSDSLHNSPSLAYLNISNNLLSRLPVDLFVGNPHLLVLDLKNNFLGNLDVGVFDSLVQLHTLDLSWNLLLGKDLSSLLFVNNKYITYLSFAGNDMNGTPDSLLQSLEVLEVLDLNSCGITEVAKFATQSNLKTIKELNLSSNKISKLVNEEIFKNLHNLEILNLAHNELEHIDENVVAPLRNLKVFNLSHNELTYLSDNLFRRMLSLENIDLSHNLISKVEVEMFLNNPLKILNLSFNMFTFLPNTFSMSLRKPNANITEFYFHQNPWQCACLKEILYEVDHLKVTHKTDVPGYMRPICVTSLEMRCIRDDSVNDVFRNMYYNILDGNRIWNTIRDSSNRCLKPRLHTAHFRAVSKEVGR